MTLDPEVERAAAEAADWIEGLDDDPTAEVHYVGLEQVWSRLSGTQREALMVDTGRHLYRRATLDALRRHDLVQAGGSGRTARGQALVDWVHAAGRWLL